jgi:hypothetical protein
VFIYRADIRGGLVRHGLVCRSCSTASEYYSACMQYSGAAAFRGGAGRLGTGGGEAKMLAVLCGIGVVGVRRRGDSARALI